ncbi:MAG: protoporphyrinogen oxidase, partial [Candidatus Eisenbacteria bacterium]|nr:protoporphyrinogen oxidase [Candidatus Latescibacterota bacterium]MBD3302160.1 protoporphyrinogen oxidase [Candidatus Eisenbacteria bacterium]
ARFLATLDAGIADDLAAIEAAGLAVAALAYRAEDLGGAPDGFGFLVPRAQGVRILGCLWDSSIFPGRAPEGNVLLRAMIGGAHDPEAVALDEPALLEIVRTDLRTTMGIETPPRFTRLYRHRLGIPQYTPGHLDRLGRIEARLRDLPGLRLVGNSYRGVAVNQCVRDAADVATAWSEEGAGD